MQQLKGTEDVKYDAQSMSDAKAVIDHMQTDVGTIGDDLTGIQNALSEAFVCDVGGASDTLNSMLGRIVGNVNTIGTNLATISTDITTVDDAAKKLEESIEGMAQ